MIKYSITYFLDYDYRNIRIAYHEMYNQSYSPLITGDHKQTNTNQHYYT